MKKYLLSYLALICTFVVHVSCFEFNNIEVDDSIPKQYETNLYQHITGEKVWVYENTLDIGEQDWSEEEYNDKVNSIVLDEPLGECYDITCKYYKDMFSDKVYQQVVYNNIVHTVTWSNGSVENISSWAVK